jgi:DNA polymerase III delta subunit
MTYLFLGQDHAAKTQELAQLKRKILPSPEAVSLDSETLYALRLDPETFQKALISLPGVASQRLIVIRECHKLNARCKELLIEFIQSKSKHAVLVLDSDEMESDNEFVKAVRKDVKVLQFGRVQELNVFNLTQAISLKRPVEALKILADLMTQGNQPLQIMGGLVWFWGRLRGKIAPKYFEQGLVALQDADRHIKRSQLKPEHALEVLVVKLCSL